MNDDKELLRRYVEKGRNEAFSALVERHVNLVYSAALRQLNGDAHLAADATQLVFTDLARKARSLVDHRHLAGWLFTSTRFVAAKLVRTEHRRYARETEAQLMQEMNRDSTPEPDWQHVRPVLDEAMNELREADREAILLRFFENRDFAAIGAHLGLAENTARMRVDRALDKLRGLLERRGVMSTSAALATALTGEVMTAAPAGLAAAVSVSALSGGTGAVVAGVAGAGGLAGIANFMSMTKVQLGLTTALAVAGASGVVYQAHENAKLRQEAARWRVENTAVAELRAENLRLGGLAAEVEELRRDDVEFARLQRETAELKTKLTALARAEDEQARRRAPGVFDISMLDQTPVPRFQARPQYPFEMRRAGITGTVVVDFVVDTNGEVTNAYALRSTQAEFEAAAVQAVSKWKFKPGMKGGRDVATHLQVPVVFSLDGQPAPSAPPAPADSSPDPAEGGAPLVKLTDFNVVSPAPPAAASRQ